MALNSERSTSHQRMRGKVALVVGAGNPDDDLDAPGVGSAIGILLAREGARVALVGLRREGVERTASAITQEGGDALALSGDVSSKEIADSIVDQALTWGQKVDLLVNNLGVRFSGHGVLDISEDEWDTVMDINVKSLLLVTKRTVPHMPSGSAIINVSSIVADRPTYKSSIVYAASKGAINSLTILLALQLADRGIRVNAVTPGNLWTPIARQEVFNRGIYPDLETARQHRSQMVPLKTEGTAWDIAYATLFLGGDEARWITGQNLTVDGGGMIPPVGAAKPS